MRACDRPGCGGGILDTGFCGDCGLPPTESPVPLADIAEAAATFVPGAATDVGPALPDVSDPDPESLILLHPYVEEGDRFCRWLGCNTPVGRELPGQPAAMEGFCHICGTEYSFTPKLAPGTVVGGHYDVLGCLDHGGMGWVYLAKDRNLQGKYVVLKGLLNSSDTAAIRMARNESRFLTELEHVNIVRIISVVKHIGASGRPQDYIVMDYVGGRTLKAISEAERPRLNLEHALLFVKDILQALKYLHEKGLLYCDMKPENVIFGSGGVKVIDFGGVRRIEDTESTKVGTPGFQVEPEEWKKYGLTVRSDIHTVGVTLRLLRAASDAGRDPRIEFGVRSADQIVTRATDTYERRFASAEEMLVQVDGVISEVHSLRQDEQAPPLFSAFHEATDILDSGLGQPPPLRTWTAARRSSVDAPWAPVLDLRCPTAVEIVRGLAPPREDPNDPNTTALENLQAADEEVLLRALDRLQERNGDSVELQLRRCRALIGSGTRRDEAAGAVERARRMLGELAAYDWRIFWHDGLLALPVDITRARRHFEAVRRNLPGEEDPKLALGLCAELHGGPANLRSAQELYHVVWARDRSQVSAAFGLVRLHLRQGNRDAAVQILSQVSDRSRHIGAARVAAFRIRCARLPGPDGSALPDDATLAGANAQLQSLPLHHEAHERLSTVLREIVLDRLVTPGRPADLGDGGDLDATPTEREIRIGLDELYRRLARQATRRRDHGRLVDLANFVRPITLA